MILYIFVYVAGVSSGIVLGICLHKWHVNKELKKKINELKKSAKKSKKDLTLKKKHLTLVQDE